MLYTARSEEFRTVEGQQRAAATCKLLGLDGIVGIGGDGTFRGLKEFSSRASASSAFRPPLITISSAPTTPSATTPRPTPPSRLSTVSETPCSRTSAAPWWRSWAATRAIWRSMSVWRRAQRPYLCRKKKLDFEHDVIDCIRGARLSGKTHYMIIVAEGGARD